VSGEKVKVHLHIVSPKKQAKTGVKNGLFKTARSIALHSAHGRI
jgi:hypothetical protein